MIGPIPSQDGQAAQTLVTFNFGKDGWNKMPDAADELRKIADQSGVSVHIAGQGGQAADSAEAFGGIDGILLVSTLLVVILILLVTYRSPVLWILPIFSAVIGLFTAQAVVYLLAKYADLTVNGQSQGILTVLVIGAGTDYALLLVARYREELRRHEDRHEAMAFALHRASPAIFASGMTVVLGMLCLLLAEMNSTAGLGPVLAVGILAALAVMTTLLPALLVICGRWVFWPKRPGFGSPEPTATGFWARVGTRVSRRPRSVWVGTAAALAVACLGILTLNANGLSSEDSYTKEFDSIVGQKVLTAHGLSDQSAPLMIVANSDKAADVAQALSGVPGLGEPSQPAIKDGVAFIAAPLDSDASSPASFTAVKQARSAVHAVPGSDALVGGATAFLLDVEKASHRDNLVIIPIVLLVVLLVLMVLLRAVTAPLILVATVVLSFGAALGISSLLFKYVFGFAGADASFPLFVFVFLVALGIDYNIFLMTRVREETPKHGTRKASLIALSATGGVITSAGLVLAATFAVLGSLPLVFLTELGSRGGAGCAARHDHRALDPGHGDQPRPRSEDLVAEPHRQRCPHRADEGRRARAGALRRDSHRNSVAAHPPRSLPWAGAHAPPRRPGHRRPPVGGAVPVVDGEGPGAHAAGRDDVRHHLDVLLGRDAGRDRKGDRPGHRRT